MSCENCLSMIISKEIILWSHHIRSIGSVGLKLEVLFPLMFWVDCVDLTF